MEGGFGTLIYLIIGYVCGVIFAPEIVSPNFMKTDWYNIWTYAWLFGWPFMLLAYYFTPLLSGTEAVPTTTPPTPVAD
jgi:hypothetical protein